MIVVLLGPPGSGKGTQAKRLASHHNWPHLSTGDMLRSAISKGTRLGIEAKVFIDQGALVPDSVVVGLIAERSQAKDCQNGFILDGFPRNIHQAEVLEEMLQKEGRTVDRVVLFEIPAEALVNRMSKRRTCVKCGAMYHLEHAPSAKPGICDQCGSQLIQRNDDLPDVIQKRLSVYNQQTEPLVEFYHKQGKLNKINAQQSAEVVEQALSRALQ